MKQNSQSGFTLIELSIVLVIIGLIVGGVLVGQDLIKAAEIRATISQIEKYNTSVNTFVVKFNAVPGDMTPGNASSLGMAPRAGGDGDGDGNGLWKAAMELTAATSITDASQPCSGETCPMLT